MKRELKKRKALDDREEGVRARSKNNNGGGGVKRGLNIHDREGLENTDNACTLHKSPPSGSSIP